ncbi:hypothetical protein TTHERM_000047049 (macronuclear) [Tetrahymena thermophila SB210]|uniref:Transmembrane protein n=1 Tax=Tetrahymena thermophila (strain SB210) TaxID=312017 RepID=W7X5G3_TETTS|nr:hypothetical protein TTHERM_000047049 [Tetrahymena thermophila SB210]EWS74610.1 hypothetical protein TTHERM_000047049 [Tetrahymena thermophila SB210]|eukprot:XP_012652832.1 hypothetical protein TTHERM_000047049 [Tetrahymena thermophila SB210]
MIVQKVMILTNVSRKEQDRIGYSYRIKNNIIPVLQLKIIKAIRGIKQKENVKQNLKKGQEF